jgi:hypothetical protein
MHRSVVALSLLLVSSAGAQPFRTEAIRAHMNFLASDLLEGRGAGTRGYDIAAEYVAAQFAAAGLEPGAGSSYLQNVPFRKTVATNDSEMTFLPDKGAPVRYRYADGFVSSGDPLHPERTLLSGRIVLVGYGITAPELKHDDYAGVDVRQKIVAYFDGAPEGFPNTLRAHYSSSSGKVENAAAHGAAGIILLKTRASWERATWSRTLRQSRLGSMHWMEAEDRPHAVLPQLSSSVTLSPRAADDLFAHMGRTLADVEADLRSGTMKAMELPVRASISIYSEHAPVNSANVVGVLRGSDPKLRDQYVVYSSHLDHLGISDPVNGDSINNGALDNASGIAVLIEIAKAFAAQPQKPRRSIIFLATTAEEKGLRGADYFANRPTVPIEQVVANINIDQILMLHAVRDVVAYGLEVSDLGTMAQKAARDMKIEISPDPYPEEVIFVRSDQYPFVKRGVPAIYVGLGYKPVREGQRPLQEQLEWFRTVYHSPQDELSQNIDNSMGAMLARYNYLLGLEVANRTAPPAWTPGNFFGEKFGRARSVSP